MKTQSKTPLTAVEPKNTGTHKKYGKWRGIRSCLSVFLAAVVTVTTIHSQVLFVQAENGGETDNRTRFTFLAPSNYQKDYHLEKKGTLADTLAQLPTSLPVNMEKTDDKTDTGETVPDVSDGNPTEDAGQKESDQDTAENTDSENAAASADNNSENKPGDTDSGENSPNMSGDATDGENSPNMSGDTVNSENNESTSGTVADSENGGDASGDAAALPDASLQTTVPDAPVYSAPGELSAAVITASGNDPSGTPGNSDPEPDSEENSPVLSTEPAPEEDSAPRDDATDDAKDTALQTAETDVSQNAALQTDETTRQELPVSWSCDHYDDMRDSYVFTATWNKSLFECTGGEVPTITVTFEETPFLVSSEEELRQAFITLFENPPEDETPVSIVLTDNIPLSDTLYIPTDWLKNIQITLESKMDESSAGFSLTRGRASSGTTFSGAMLLFGNYPAQGADVPAPASTDSSPAGALTLTLRNITIDGKVFEGAGINSSMVPTENNKADAPAVISSGHLILESGARIVHNYNCGTYLRDENGSFVLDENDAKVYDIPPCGGGLWVCGGTVDLQKGCHIQYNAADRSGGGIYLNPGAVLRHYTEAEALTGNTAVTGGGADLYACANSTIYYDPAVFIQWSTFYIDPAAALIPDGFTLDTDTPIEIYLNVDEDSGYSFREVKDKLESAFGDKVTVLLPQTYIDTTDLRNWYVYDHYDTNCWEQADTNGNNIPDSWEKAYSEYLHRPYYAYVPTHTASLPASDIPTWLKRNVTSAASGRTLYLDPFKEHIYSRTENGRPEMTFAGYDVKPSVDFLFYDPKSNGEKIVNFDVDSTKVNTHTLDGNGFLVNTGIKTVGGQQTLSGYLIYYTYEDEKVPDGTTTDENGNTITTWRPTGRTIATNISLYKFDNVNIANLHDNGISILTSGSGSKLIGTSELNGWDDKMSIEIIVSPEKITVAQQPKNGGGSAAKFEWEISDNGYNGFGPLVAYTRHSCQLASSFTYSDLHMRFTNPDREKSLLSSLMEADFSQKGNVKKYFLNLLGKSGSASYGDETSTEFGQYHEFLYLMQHEGVGLITDADTPFEKYLGQNGSKNLYEIPNPDKKADLNGLVTSLRSYLYMYNSTEIGNPEGANLTTSPAAKPIGNIWLADANNVQIRGTLNCNALRYPYIMNVMDIACNLPQDQENTITYSLLKPGSSTYLPLGTETGGTEEAAAFSLPGRSSGVSFVITDDPVEWPTGEYVVRQQVNDSTIYGYSYFTLTRPAFTEEQPEPVPVPVPDTIIASPASSSPGRPEIAALTGTPEILPSDGASQPKTGDGMFPAMPVACGACTAFMLKIMLWMYDMDFEAITELKLDTVQALISWGKGAAKPRVYLAIAALTVVITAYHIVKALYESSRQFVRERLGKA